VKEVGFGLGMKELRMVNVESRNGEDVLGAGKGKSEIERLG